MKLAKLVQIHLFLQTFIREGTQHDRKTGTLPRFLQGCTEQKLLQSGTGPLSFPAGGQPGSASAGRTAGHPASASQLQKGGTDRRRKALLYEYASSALGLLESAEHQLGGLHELKVGQLRLAAGDITARHLLLPALEHFHQIYPQVHLSIFNRTSMGSLELLRAGRIDAAFLNLPIEDDRITVHWERPIHDIFVAGEKFSALKEKTLTLRELAAQPLIMLEEKANSRLYVQRFFLRKGIELNPEIELASYELMGELARINLGLSCMVREFCAEELRQKKVFEVNLAEPIPARSIGMVSLKGVSLPPAASRFLELLQSLE